MRVNRLSLLAGTNLLVLVSLGLVSPAVAQDVEDESGDDVIASPSTEANAVRGGTEGAAPEETQIVVTGSRVASGFNSPTPVTSASSEQLRSVAPQNIADGLAQLPAFGGTLRATTVVTAATGGTNGQSLLNLRNIGPNRTLVLLDGRRLPSSNTLGSVDVNVIPQNLVSRVEVVTGGASAAYGSDAVAGVVNFILDTQLEGLRAEVLSGISTYGDLPSLGASLAGGTSFADDRARIIASVEYFQQDGLSAAERSGRDWYDVAYGQIPNPNGTVPTVIVIPDIRSSLGSYGGLISSGPLRGTQFLSGGGTAPFDYGNKTGSSFQSGGDGARLNIGFAPDQERVTAFVHSEYDITDSTSLFVEGLYGRSQSISGNSVTPRTGAGGQFTIFRDNAYLPSVILDRMITAGVQSIPVGRYFRDFPVVEIETLTKLKRGAVGVRGTAFEQWDWDASYSFGQVDQRVAQNNLPINRNIYAAVDAVRDPATGEVACRSTLMGLDPNCVPLNILGEGAPSQASIDYVLGSSIKDLVLKQHVVQFNVNGDFGENLSFGAGPVGIAAGFEYRKESANQTVDPLSASVTSITGVRGAPSSLQNRPGGYQFFNPLPLSGEYDIKEGYVEVVVPLLEGQAFANALDLNGAVRYADYSQSGGVTTWKGGVNYEIVPDIRLRLTRSRDIRGPNILELFNSATQNSSNNIYNGITTPSLIISSGNPNLRPEKADTLTYGVVLRPYFIPGFQASIDYYDISIEDAVGTLNSQRILDDCAIGNALACSQFLVNPNGTLIISIQSLNLSVQKVSGYDFEILYSRPIADGDVTLRLLANPNTESYTEAPNSPRVLEIDSPTTPKWRGNLQLRYTSESLSLFAQQRYISSAKTDPNRVEGVYTNDNSVPEVWYTDIGGTIKVPAFGDTQELFFSVNNLFDRAPPVAPPNPTSYSQPTNALAYDTIGRYFSVGVRIRLP